jgi:tetratricopeptide (TPR) repeat protein
MVQNPESQSDPLVTARAHYVQGKAAFERGQYRRSIEAWEAALNLINPNSILGGEVQIWLTLAYEAKGQRQAARDLCRRVEKHPDRSTRKQAERLLYILEAPQLETRSEWLMQIPDLANVSDENSPLRQSQGGQGGQGKQPPAKKILTVSPQEICSGESVDNAFIWVALGAIGLACAGLLWFG